MGKIYNISSETSLVDFLAERFFEQYKFAPEQLSEVMFLLPSRRACNNLKESFVRINGLKPTILPEILPILDADDGETFLSNINSILDKIKPELEQRYRALIFTKMIMSAPQKWGIDDISTAQAYALAQNLAALVDLAYENELSFANLKNIVAEEYAEHWQQILRLLAIITEYWPKILADEQREDSVKLRIELLREKIARWQKNPPHKKIVVAGTTAGFPVLKELVKTVSELKNGEVYLYELDSYLSDSDWNKIEENHPQFELKELLDYLGIKRHDIATQNSDNFSPKQRLISEIMRPSTATDEWQKIAHNKFNDTDLAYLKILNCDDLRQEAYAIALIMREALETPEKTAALVTPDRNLARRVADELRRWNIIADDTSGQPLHLTPIGIYLRLIINVCEQNFSNVSLLALLKHPFTKCAMPADKYKIMIYQIEQKWRSNDSSLLSEEENALLSAIYKTLKPLNDMYFAPTLNLKQMFEEHIKAAEKLADTAEKTGDKIIWRKEDGIAAAKFVAEFYEQAEILGNIPSNDYSKLLNVLLSEQTVRAKFGQHPRIKILGPIEARLQKFDITVIGEANEGKWPCTPQADMWMSRPMKKEFGIPLPERAIGISGADFAHLLSGDKVFITRAEKDDGAPTTKSRWLLRLETVLAANCADTEQSAKQAYSFIYDTKYTQLAKNSERASSDEIAAHKIGAPAPKPPLYARPRKLSAGKFADWICDPYIIYARYILKLYPLDKLDKPLSAVDYGNFIHAILFEFNSKNPAVYPPKDVAVAEMKKIADKLFEEWQIPADTAAFWRPAVDAAVEWIANREIQHRGNIKHIYNEIEGQTTYKSKGGDFIINARADRLEENLDGSLSVIDYKTGNIPSGSAVESGFAPQLPAEALIARDGGFANLKGREIDSLAYWQINNKTVDFPPERTANAMQNTQKRIGELIEDFDDENTAYYSHPNPAFSSKCADYDHLARYLEWSLKDSENSQSE